LDVKAMSENFESMLAQARELQRSVADAMTEATEHVKPVLAAGGRPRFGRADAMRRRR